MISSGYRCPLYDTALATTSDPPSVRAAQPSRRCLAKFGEVLIDASTVEATIVRFRLAVISPAALVDALHERGVWMQRPAPTEFAPCSTSTSAHMMSKLR